ncbi:MAG: mechanosensitive ion channel family protein [Acidobacteriota bacterium]
MIRRLLAAFLFAACLTPAQTALDRLGRTTPKTTVLGFLRTAHDGNFNKAAAYLLFDPGASPQHKAEAARQLLFILDRGFIGNLDSISSNPEGAAEDGADRETIGAIVGVEQSSPVTLVRVNQSGQLIWLFSRETIESSPQLFSEFGFPWLEAHLPRPLIDWHLWSMPLWVLLAILLALPLSFAIAWSLVRLTTRSLPLAWGVSPRPNPPIVFLITVMLHNLASRLLGLPLLYRVWYSRLVKILWIALFVWAIFSIISYSDRRIRQYLSRNSLTATQSVLQLGRRLLQMLVLLGAALVALKSFGYDITAALAGLGIGGIAIAFAAQKTLENLFGGFTLLSDRSIRVGDSCQFGPTVATVEDIGLRATRFRTIQRSTLYIPNGQLASMNIENLGQRDQILFRHTIGVKYGLAPTQLKALLAELRSLLETDPRVSPENRRVRFLKFGAYSLEIEFFAYILTSDFPEFLAIQEELLLRVMDIVNLHDSGFAFPSQTLYVERGQLDLAPPLPSTSDSSQTT